MANKFYVHNDIFRYEDEVFGDSEAELDEGRCAGCYVTQAIGALLAPVILGLVSFGNMVMSVTLPEESEEEAEEEQEERRPSPEPIQDSPNSSPYYESHTVA